MNDIDNLLEKYFNGVSSTEEEKRLKNYFEGTGILPEHEIYRPVFAAFNTEKQIKAPVMTFPEKKTRRPAITRRIIILLAGSAAIGLLAVAFSNLQYTRSQHPEYMVIVNGKQVVNQHKAQQYAEYMFSETDKIIENSYQLFREAATINQDLNAEKILKETDQKIECIKTNYKQ